MAGTIPLSMTQQLDEFGAPLAGGKLYIIQAGTTSTPQNAYQDSALTLPLPNPIILSASGRLPQFFLADGSIKIRLTDLDGVEKLVADGLVVTGASSGGGGGSPVDPTTVLQTGWLQQIYGTGVVSGFVRCNARTIGSATSGATERANADTNALFSFLWNGDPNLVVSTGRGASAAADFSANKTIALPDLRGRVLAGLDDMGNTAAGRITAASGFTGTTLGNAAGAETRTLTAAQIPSITSSTNFGGFNVPVTASPITDDINTSSAGPHIPTSPSTWAGISSATSTSTNTGGQAHPTMPPALLATIYIKL